MGRNVGTGSGIVGTGRDEEPGWTKLRAAATHRRFASLPEADDGPIPAATLRFNRFFHDSMPAYDYKCRACGTPFEVRRTVAEHTAGTPVTCPLCESKDTERVFTPIAIGAASGGGASRESMPSGPSCGPGCGCHSN